MVQKWDQKTSICRLLAATVAATGTKFNYQEIASFYGQGATYDSIEGQFRKIRKQATELKEARLREQTTPTTPLQAKSFDTATASFTSNPSTQAPKTPRKPRASSSAKKARRATKAEESYGIEKVAGSRVTKKTGTLKTAKMMKQESGDDAEGDDETEHASAEGDDETEHASAEGRKVLNYDEFGLYNWWSPPDPDGDFEKGFHGSQI